MQFTSCAICNTYLLSKLKLGPAQLSMFYFCLVTPLSILSTYSNPRCFISVWLFATKGSQPQHIVSGRPFYFPFFLWLFLHSSAAVKEQEFFLAQTVKQGSCIKCWADMVILVFLGIPEIFNHKLFWLKFPLFCHKNWLNNANHVFKHKTYFLFTFITILLHKNA